MDAADGYKNRNPAYHAENKVPEILVKTHNLADIAHIGHLLIGLFFSDYPFRDLNQHMHVKTYACLTKEVSFVVPTGISATKSIADIAHKPVIRGKGGICGN